MEVKGILEKIRQSKEEKKECFWALQIGFGLVKTAIWTVENGLVKILYLGETKPYQVEEELLEAIDASLSSAAEKLAAQKDFLEPNKVVLGLTSSWVKENKIIPEKTKFLKKISKELELNLIGFVVIEEAIVHQLKTIEGIPLSAILVYLERQKLGVSLVNLGKILGSEQVAKSDDLGADLIEGLSRIKAEGVFPARIVLYGIDGDYLDEAKQEITSYSWQKLGTNFLHLPKTEILESDFDIKAVALAGGREVAGAAGIQKVDQELFKEEEEKKPEEAEKKIEEPATMGFVKEADVAEKKSVLIEPKKPKLRIPKINFSWIRKINLSFFKFLPQKIPAVGGLAAALLFVLGGILAALYWFLPRAQIVLFIQPQILEKEFAIKLDPSLDLADQENLALPAEKVAVVLEGEKTIATTGTKTIGEPAKGEVIIYNGTSQEKSFNAETVITSSSGIKFTLDDDVTVASQSGTAAEPVSGKATVKVTAVEIGPEGNLAAGAEFTLANYSQSDYVAKNESAFSGGTSREVQVVSSQDQKNLLADLRSELEERALGELSTEISSEQKLVEETLDSQAVSQNFDKKADQEADEVGLSLKLKFTVLSFREAEFKDLIEEEVRAAVPDGFEYKPEENETTFELNKVADDGVALFSAYFKTKLVPIYDLEEIKNNLTGKSLVIGQTYLNNLPHLDSFEAKVVPQLPGRLASFPRFSKNIKIETVIK